MDTLQLEALMVQRPHSPLCVRLANDYLTMKQDEDAEEICRSAVQQFPLYPTAHLIFARTYANKEDYVSALLHLQGALNLIPDSSMLQKLSMEWKEKAESQNIVKHAPKVPVVHEFASPQGGEKVLPPEPESSVIDSADSEHEQIDEYVVPGVTSVILPPVVEQVPVVESESSHVQQFQSVEPSIAEPHRGRSEERRMPVEGGRIVSKTLAEIYAAQGAYQEAILTYKLLKQQRPAFQQEFDQRIKELELKLSAKTSQ